MDQLAAYVRRINEVCPDLSVEQAALDDTGQYNDVVMVNEALVFRFPRYADGLPWLHGEVAVLRGIQPYVPLRVPNPIYTSLEPLAVGQSFIGYERIPGEGLWRETIQTLDDDLVLDRLAAQLGAFLKALHQVPVERAIDAELPRVDTREEIVDFYARIQHKLLPLMRPDAREAVREHFESYLNDPQHFDYVPALRHGDFGTFNLLYDPVAQNMVGVLDFGGAALGDPAVDFAGLLSTAGYGESFVQRCFLIYPEAEAMLDRARFYVGGFFALEEALFGLEHDDPAAFEAGMQNYI